MTRDVYRKREVIARMRNATRWGQEYGQGPFVVLDEGRDRQKCGNRYTVEYIK